MTPKFKDNNYDFSWMFMCEFNPLVPGSLVSQGRNKQGQGWWW